MVGSIQSSPLHSPANSGSLRKSEYPQTRDRPGGLHRSRAHVTEMIVILHLRIGDQSPSPQFALFINNQPVISRVLHRVEVVERFAVVNRNAETFCGGAEFGSEFNSEVSPGPGMRLRVPFMMRKARPRRRPGSSHEGISFLAMSKRSPKKRASVRPGREMVPRKSGRAPNAKQHWERAFNSAHAEAEQQRRTTQRVFEE
jgi:hypothetical protein